MTVGRGVGVSGELLGYKLVALRHAIDSLELEFAQTAADFARTDEYDEQGFDSAISWVKQNCHMSGGAAADRVCAGEQLERLVESSIALAAGQIGFARFALIARTSAAVGGRLDETKLLRQAAKLSVARFRNECMHARHASRLRGLCG